MGDIKASVKEEKGPLGFGVQYRAEISESDNFGFAVNQVTVVNTTPEKALSDAVERFTEKK